LRRAKKQPWRLHIINRGVEFPWQYLSLDHYASMGDTCYEETVYPDGCTDADSQCGLRLL
jgi:hypothetical protein